MNNFGINIIDVVIVLFILCGGVVGLKRGVFKELVMTIGYLILIAVSLIVKAPLAEFLSLHLPFFNFGGAFEGLVVFNILLYQTLAFLIVFAVLSIIFNVVLLVTKIFEKLLDLTVVLGIFSKILGLLVGLIDGYILVFVFCFLLSFPIFNQTVVSESKFKDQILYSTPVLSNIVGKMNDTVKEVGKLTDSEVIKNKDEFNRQTIDIMLEHDLVTTDYIDKLVANDKLNVPDLDKVVDKYK